MTSPPLSTGRPSTPSPQPPLTSHLHSVRARRGGRRGVDDALLDAAALLIIEEGGRPITMSDLARRAEVSRATVYRRWSSVEEAVSALVAREWERLAASVLHPPHGHTRQTIATLVVHVVHRLRATPLMRALMSAHGDTAPAVRMPLGTTLPAVRQLVEALHEAIATGTVRDVDAELQAYSLILTGWSFLTAGPLPSRRDATGDPLDAELFRVVDRYLMPDEPASL